MNIDTPIDRRTFIAGGGAALVSFSLMARSGAALAQTRTSSQTIATLGISDDLSRWSLGQGWGELARALGAELVRFPLRWDEVQTARDTWDWSAYEGVREQCAEYGLRPMPVLIGCPSWVAADSPTDTSSVDRPRSGPALNLLGHFSSAVIEFFAAGAVQLEAIEVWNQPNSAGPSGIESPAAYAQMVETVALFVFEANRRASRPDVPVISGGLLMSGDDSSWKAYLEAVRETLFAADPGLQPYPEDRAEAGAAAEVRGLLAEASERVFSVTATGASSASGVEEQARVVGGIADALVSEGACTRAFFGPLQGTQSSGSENGEGADSTYALLDRDGQPRPAFGELQRRWAA